MSAFPFSMNNVLIFSGGGARGAFQIGCWKAMEELGKTQMITAVFGTSVGAINGAAFVQGDLDLAERIWAQMDYDKVFENVPISRNNKFSRRFYAIARQALKQKGLDVSPLKSILRKELCEDKIRQSPLDFGLVVFDWTKKRPIYLKKNQIPEGELIEYIIASSTFPVFQPHRINDQIFIDGGVYDNRPIAFCEDIDNLHSITCVDVTIARHFWPNKKRKLSNIIDFIRPSSLLGSPLAFQHERIMKNIDLGYSDTLNHFTAMSK